MYYDRDIERVYNALCKVNKQVANIYLDTANLLQKSDLRNSSIFIAHGMREVINNLVRKEKEKDTSALEEGLKKHLSNEEEINLFIEVILKRDTRQSRRNIEEFLSNYIEGNTEGLTNELKVLQTKVAGISHGEGVVEKSTLKEDFDHLSQILKQVFCYSFIDAKRQIDEFIAIKSYDFQKLNILLSNNKALKNYFFLNLKDEKLFEELNNKEHLSIILNEEYKVYVWPAYPYIKKIIESGEVKDLVVKSLIKIIKNTLKDLDNESFKHYRFNFIQNILELAPSIDQKNYCDCVGGFLNKYLSKTSLGYVVNPIVLSNFIKTLSKHNEDLTIQIIKTILALKVDSHRVDANAVSIHFSLYSYKPTLKDFNDVLLNQETHELKLKYLKILVGILSDLFKDNKDLFSMRNSIEDTMQNLGADKDEHYLLDAIRDFAIGLVDSNLDNLNTVIATLEEQENIVFKRLVMHILKLYPANKQEKIASYLIDNFKDSSKMHYEHYTLMEQEYKNLNNESKDKIISLIEQEYQENLKNPDTTDNPSYAQFYRYKRFYCIQDSLPETQQEEFSRLKEKIGVLKHPQFLWYYLGTYRVQDTSPIKLEEFASKDLSEVIKYLKDFTPPQNQEDREKPVTRKGLAKILRDDLTQNQDKYTKNILEFKGLCEPTYFYEFFNTLRELSKQGNLDVKVANSDFVKTSLRLAEWMILQKPLQDRDGYYEEIDWESSYICLLEFIKDFVFKEQNKHIIDYDLLQNIVNVCNKFVTRADKRLEGRNKDQSIEQVFSSSYVMDRPLDDAINSAHGIAMQCLFDCLFFILNNELEDSDKVKQSIFSIFDNILQNSSYRASWGIFGLYISQLQAINKEWLVNNLDNILPEDDEKKFYSAWLSYLGFSVVYDDVFEVLKNKFLYVIEKDLIVEDYIKTLGGHIAIYYTNNLIKFDSEYITYIVETKNKEAREGFFDSILHNYFRNKDNKLNDEQLRKIQDLCDKFMSFIEGREKDYISELDSLKLLLPYFKNLDWSTKIVEKLTSNDVVMINRFVSKDCENFLQKLIENKYEGLVLEIFEKYFKVSQHNVYRITILKTLEDIFTKCCLHINKSSDTSLIDKKNDLVNSIIEENINDNQDFCNRMEKLILN